jgi:hypothetical protein
VLITTDDQERVLPAGAASITVFGRVGAGEHHARGYDQSHERQDGLEPGAGVVAMSIASVLNYTY